MGSGQSKQATGTDHQPQLASKVDPAFSPSPHLQVSVTAAVNNGKSHDENSVKKESLLTKPSMTSEESNSSSKCPMHRADGSYSFDWRAMLSPSFPHGPNGRKPLVVNDDDNNKDQDMENEARAKIARRATALDAAMASPGGLCPVQHREYNVYAQPIDPSNQMPKNANQLPAPGQTTALSTDRVKSNIPKVRCVSFWLAKSYSFGGAGRSHISSLPYFVVLRHHCVSLLIKGWSCRWRDMDLSFPSNVLQCARS